MKGSFEKGHETYRCCHYTHSLSICFIESRTETSSSVIPIETQLIGAVATSGSQQCEEILLTEIGLEVRHVWKGEQKD